ncbi:unnamed protein product [Caenorhabditis auriculariae]|uniref:DUF19 domain-containing protein n=1 Tax=Caenorhabditis auriculariae TaxID=2777116 RepID=A0A8S1H6J5_9PELO|nr:unnamed protein product [Caenorhabditis auriculariae]
MIVPSFLSVLFLSSVFAQEPSGTANEVKVAVDVANNTITAKSEPVPVPEKAPVVEVHTKQRAPAIEIETKRLDDHSAVTIVVPTTPERHEEIGLHEIVEQQLSMKYYHFLCSPLDGLDCKVSETLKICMKDDFVSILGMPLRFDKGSIESLTVKRWIQKCRGNNQTEIQEVMDIIRKRIVFHSEHHWNNVFNGGSSLWNGSLLLLALLGLRAFF